MLAQRDHRGHPFTLDGPTGSQFGDDEHVPRYAEELGEPTARTDGGEWEPEPAELRDGEPTDEQTHAARNAEIFAMEDTDPDPDETESTTDYDGDIKIGDVVLDLAQGRPMHVLEDTQQTAAEWTGDNGYDLCGNYANSRFDADPDDRVFECVYCSNVKSEPSKTYAFPSSRLVRIETEAADGGRQVYDRAVVDVLEQLYSVAKEEKSCLFEPDLSLALDRIDVDRDVVDEAKELAEAAQFGGE